MNYNALITVFFLIFLFTTYYRTKKRNDKKILLNNLSIIYERMEIYLLNNNISYNDDIVKFLKSHKNIVVNPDFADIKIIMNLRETMAETKQSINSIDEKNIPMELHSLSNQFKTNFVGLVKLSMLHWSFIRTCLFCGTILFVSYVFKVSDRVFQTTNKRLGSFIKTNPDVVSVLTHRNQENLTQSLLPN